MINIDELYKKFCDALPDTLEITEDKKREAFNFIFNLCYIFIIEGEKDLFE